MPSSPRPHGDVTGRRPDAPRRTARDLADALFTVSRSQLLIGLLLCLFGMAAVTQIRSHASDSAYSTARRADLVSLLDSLDEETKRLETEKAGLERTQSQLQSGVDRERVAREEATKRIQTLSILAGTVPARGPGVRLIINAPAGAFTSDMLLDAIEEMRDAGAEVIEINDTVRVVASTSFASGPNRILADGHALSSPIVLEVVGNADALEEAARFRGGLVSQVQAPKVGGSVLVMRAADLRVDSLHTPTTRRFAKPA